MLFRIIQSGPLRIQLKFIIVCHLLAMWPWECPSSSMSKFKGKSLFHKVAIRTYVKYSSHHTVWWIPIILFSLGLQLPKCLQGIWCTLVTHVTMPKKVVSQKENTCQEERVRRGINMGGYLNPKNHMNLTQTDKSSQSLSQSSTNLSVSLPNHWFTSPSTYCQPLGIY